jgi:hypothetical protein
MVSNINTSHTSTAVFQNQGDRPLLMATVAFRLFGFG